jgi:hypothetical protein
VDKAADLETGLVMASEAIDSGGAARKLVEMAQFAQDSRQPNVKSNCRRETKRYANFGQFYHGQFCALPCRLFVTF